jgi:hypothetical protein
MNEVRFGRDEHGAVTVLVPDAYEPIDQLLYDDLRGNRAALTEILDHARNPTGEWGTGGNSCWVTIRASTATIENEYSGQSTTLPLGTLIEIIEAYLRELDATNTDGGS